MFFFSFLPRTECFFFRSRPDGTAAERKSARATRDDFLCVNRPRRSTGATAKVGATSTSNSMCRNAENLFCFFWCSKNEGNEEKQTRRTKGNEQGQCGNAEEFLSRKRHQSKMKLVTAINGPTRRCRFLVHFSMQDKFSRSLSNHFRSIFYIKRYK